MWNRRMRVWSLPLKLRNKRMFIRLRTSGSENCALKNRTNEMNRVRETNSKNNNKTFDQVTYFTKNNEPFYAKNAHLKVANFD